MCVSISITKYSKGIYDYPYEITPLPVQGINVPFVQEAIFYNLENEEINIVVTAFIENKNAFPVAVWFFHEASVIVDSRRELFTNPEKDPHVATLMEILSTNLADVLLPQYGKQYASMFINSNTQPQKLPIECDEAISKNVAPYICLSFSPIANEQGPFNVVRFKLSIRDKTLLRLIKKINGSKQYFYGIKGPEIVLDDIKYSHISHTPSNYRNSYKALFDKIAKPFHVPIGNYQVITFDPVNNENSIRYNRGLAEASYILENYPFQGEHLNRQIVNAWASTSERFAILRASILD